MRKAPRCFVSSQQGPESAVAVVVVAVFVISQASTFSAALLCLTDWRYESIYWPFSVH